MKTLLLMRHAKSSWDNSALSDHQRPLNDRGRRDAPAMGSRLAASEYHPDRILSSTADRARQTAEFVVEALRFLGSLETCDGIYHATPAEILAVIAEVDGGSTLLIIGHNPGLSELVERLTETPTQMPTAGIAAIELPIEAWQEITNAKGKLIDLWKPKDND